MTAIQSHTHTLLRNNNGIQIAYRKNVLFLPFSTHEHKLKANKQNSLTHSRKHQVKANTKMEKTVKHSAKHSRR